MKTKHRSSRRQCRQTENVVAGNRDTNIAFGQIPKAWVLNVTKCEVEIPATPNKPKGGSTGLHQIMLSWKIDKATYNTLTLKGY